MSAKTAYISALALTFLSLCSARGQYQPTMPSSPDLPRTGPEAAPLPSAAVEPPGRLSDWITHGTCTAFCLGPFGGDGPIQAELYLRNGISVPIGGGSTFNTTLQNGWNIQGGGRGLL